MCFDIEVVYVPNRSVIELWLLHFNAVAGEELTGLVDLALLHLLRKLETLLCYDVPFSFVCRSNEEGRCLPLQFLNTSWYRNFH